jgi:hypothetical protein
MRKKMTKRKAKKARRKIVKVMGEKVLKVDLKKMKNKIILNMSLSRLWAVQWLG